jgi:hypothetical protein
MRKRTSKLRLHSETLRILTLPMLSRIGGGTDPTVNWNTCHTICGSCDAGCTDLGPGSGCIGGPMSNCFDC